MEDKGFRCSELVFGVRSRDVFGTCFGFAWCGDGLITIEQLLGLRPTWTGINWMRLWELEACSLSLGGSNGPRFQLGRPVCGEQVQDKTPCLRDKDNQTWLV